MLNFLAVPMIHLCGDLQEFGMHFPCIMKLALGFSESDADYPLEPWLLTPVSSPTVGSANERYKKKHATTRNCIERCIGVLKSRFRCLLHARELTYEPTTAGKIVNACAVLHNICRHYKLPDVENDCREEPWGPIP
ncbi:putative nuclease HARBI1, partial [Stegodyphus mimosarum]